MGRPKKEPETAARQAWLKKNPLAMWLAADPMRRKVKAVADQLGMSRTAVYYWLQGTKPSTEELEHLAQIMEEDFVTLSGRWARWWAYGWKLKWLAKDKR